MFGKRKDWGRIAKRCDGCARTCTSAIATAAVVTFCSDSMILGVGEEFGLGFGGECPCICCDYDQKGLSVS